MDCSAQKTLINGPRFQIRSLIGGFNERLGKTAVWDIVNYEDFMKMSWFAIVGAVGELLATAEFGEFGEFGELGIAQAIANRRLS